MSDLIDKQSVVDIAMCYCPDDDGSCSKADADIRELLDEIENLQAVNRWIPCSERLPETIEPVIFSVERGYKQVCCGYRYGKHRMWRDRISGLHYTDYDVIAWMPMPDAYEPPESEV